MNRLSQEELTREEQELLKRTEIVSPTAGIVYVENIGFVYPAMSMMVLGPSLPIQY